MQAPTTLIETHDCIDAAVQFARERTYAASMGAAPSSHLILWSTPRTIVLAARHHAAAQRVADEVEPLGWACAVRESGGEPVAIGPACLNVTAIERAPERFSIDAEYGRFCARLSLALAQLGLSASTGSLPGSYCDGRFNILVGGRKLAGTALRVYSFAGHRALLSHAVFTVESSAMDYLDVLARALRACNGGTVQRDTVTTLSALLGSDSGSELRERFQASVAAAFLQTNLTEPKTS